MERDASEKTKKDQAMDRKLTTEELVFSIQKQVKDAIVLKKHA